MSSGYERYESEVIRKPETSQEIVHEMLRTCVSLLEKYGKDRSTDAMARRDMSWDNDASGRRFEILETSQDNQPENYLYINFFNQQTGSLEGKYLIWAQANNSVGTLYYRDNDEWIRLDDYPDSEYRGEVYRYLLEEVTIAAGQYPTELTAEENREFDGIILNTAIENIRDIIDDISSPKNSDEFKKAAEDIIINQLTRRQNENPLTTVHWRLNEQVLRQAIANRQSSQLN